MPSQAKKVALYARAVKEIGIEVQKLLRHEESDGRSQRARTLQMLDLALDEEKNTVEDILKETNASLLHLTKQSKMAIARENSLIDKVQKKKSEVERNYKLIASLNIGGVQPAHQAQYEELEEELQVEYERYVVKIRNKDYLESELRSYHSLLLQQRERAERKARRMQNTYREETLLMLQGEEGEEEPVNRDGGIVANTSFSDEEIEPSRSSDDESLSAPSDNESDDMSEEDSDSDNHF